MPYTVRHPETGLFFTDVGAWEFIADCLKAHCGLKCIQPTQCHPAHSYYLLENGAGHRRIYMKIAIRAEIRKVIGLSFHYEDPR
jgi:hypothetical protein